MKQHITITAIDHYGYLANIHFKTLDGWVPLEPGAPSIEFLPYRVIKIELNTTKGDDDTTIHLYTHPIRHEEDNP